MSSKEGRVFVREATGLTRQISGKSALVGNVMSMGIAYVFVFAFFASLLYTGADLPFTVLFTLLPAVVFSLIYYLFSVSMPRSGGEYVWVTRTVNPITGFMANYLITFVLLTTIAVAAVWAIIYGLGPMIAGLGVVYKSSSLVNLSTTVTSTPTSFLITVFLMSVFIIPLFIGTRTVFAVVWATFLIAAVGTLVTIAAFFSAPNSTFVANFNQLSGMDYTKTISTAALPRGFTVSATLIGSIFTVTNFLGFNYSAYYGGEVKRVTSSQILAMLGSVVLFGFFLTLVYGSAYYSAGSDFLNAVSNLAGTSNPTYKLAAVPVLNFLVAFAAPNPVIVFISGLALIATGLGTVTIDVFVCVRNLFAWSFDRVMPTWIAKIDAKRSTPYASVAVIWVLSILFVGVYYYTIFFQYYLYSTFEEFLGFGLTCVAAILFFSRRKDIFNSSPDVVKKKLAGIPIITILGVIGIVLAAFLAYSTVTPAVTPPPSGTILVQALAYAIVPVSIVVGLVIYTVAHYYRKRQGIDLNMAFREIPPE